VKGDNAVFELAVELGVCTSRCDSSAVPFTISAKWEPKEVDTGRSLRPGKSLWPGGALCGTVRVSDGVKFKPVGEVVPESEVGILGSEVLVTMESEGGCRLRGEGPITQGPSPTDEALYTEDSVALLAPERSAGEDLCALGRTSFEVFPVP
jgi:hypothetical protein